MSYQRPTLQELVTRIYGDLVSKSGVKSSVLKKSFLKAISYAVAGATHLLYGYLDHIIKQAFPTTCSELYLNVWGYVYGVSRKQATYAIRKILAVGASGSVIPEATILKNNDGVEYTTQAEGQIAPGGNVEILIQCSLAGEDGNVETDDVLSFLSPIVGVNSSVTVTANGAIDGENQEEVEAWRSRVLLKIQEPPSGGNAQDYRKWILDIPGVTRAWVYPQYLGDGTVGVAFVNDANEDIFPIPAKVAEVQAIIDELRPVTAELFVFAPIEDETDFTIQILPNNSTVREAVTRSLENLFTEEGEPGGTILMSHIREAISVATGENDHVLVSPTEDVVSLPGHLATVGTITFDSIT